MAKTFSERKTELIKGIKKYWIGYCYALFFLFFWIKDGYVICADSASYINMDVSREAMYPLFLATLRAVFGDAHYLAVATLIQSAFNAYADFQLTDTMRQRFRLENWQVWCVIAIQMVPVLLNRFVAKRASTYSCSIMTESFTIPLWLLLFSVILDYSFEETDSRKKYVFKSLLIAGILIGFRKQMLVTLPLLVCVLVSREVLLLIRNGRAYAKSHIAQVIGTFVWPVIAVGMVLGCVNLLEGTYNWVLRGGFSKHTDSSNTIFTVTVYTSDYNAAQYITEPLNRMLFEQIWMDAEENGRTYDGFAMQTTEENTSGLGSALLLEEHYSNAYDAIAIETSQPIFERVLRSEAEGNDQEIGQRADAMRMSIVKEVLPHNLDKVMKVYGASFLHGMILTIAVQRAGLNEYCMIAYLAYVCITLWLFKRNVFSKAAYFALIVGLAIVGNVVLTSLVIFCQTRYMIYNMPLFYLAGFCLLRELVNESVRLKHLLMKKLPEDEAFAILNQAVPRPELSIIRKEKKNYTKEFDLQVIVPAHNEERYIEECISSLLEQTTDYKILIVVVNNGSSDRTGDILKQIEGEWRRDSRNRGNICLELHNVDYGDLGKARNEGMENLRADYLLFVDGDDRMEPGALDAMVSKAKETAADVVEGSYYTFDAYGGRKEYLLEDNNHGDFLHSMNGYAWGRLYRTAIWQRICFPEYVWFEDTCIPFLCAPQIHIFASLSKVVYGYRQNASGISANADGRPRSIDTWWCTEGVLKAFRDMNFEWTSDMKEQIEQQFRINERRMKGRPWKEQQAIFSLQENVKLTIDRNIC